MVLAQWPQVMSSTWKVSVLDIRMLLQSNGQRAL